MRILVTGGSGFIGSRFVKYLVKQKYDVHFTYNKNKCSFEVAQSHQLDVTNRDASKNLVYDLKPELVIHTVAVPSMDLCETNKNLAKAVNVGGTKNIVDACQKLGSKVVFISTSTVFDGAKPLYDENDQPNPINYHGLTHLEGEKIIINSGLPFLVLRTDQPYGWVESWQKKNSVIRILESLERNETVKEILDWYNTPTYIDNLIEVAINLIKKEKEGVYHTVGPDFVNRCELALKIAEIFNKDKNLIKPINSKELNLPAKRGVIRLNNKRAESESGIKLVGIIEGLKEMLKSDNEIRY